MTETQRRLETLGPIFAVFMLSIFAVGILFPASFWFEVERLDIHDGIAGQPVTVDYARTIHRPFVADWRGKVWRVEPDGSLTWVCATPAQREDYEPTAKLPADGVTLEWLLWSHDGCWRLPPGDYLVGLTWDINPIGFASLFTQRSVSARDTFTISEAPK